MTLVDSSVWIEFFRGRDASVRRRLDQLLENDQVVLSAFVRLELLAGVRSTEVPKMQRLLDALPALPVDNSQFSWCEDRLKEGRARGVRFGTLDLLIAAQASLSDCGLWSLDADFKRMATLGWVRLSQAGA